MHEGVDIYKAQEGYQMSDIVCTSCGYVGKPALISKGSIWIEIVLWICFLIPGVIYSIWRMTSKQAGCPSCGQTTVIPIGSPIGQKFVRENLPANASAIATSQVARPPSTAAHGAGMALGRLVRRIVK